MLKSDHEFAFLRDFWTALNNSGTVGVFRNSLLPAFFIPFGWAIPADIRSIYPSF